MITKQRILEEIKRTTKENGGIPLGISRFEKETGIKPYEWGKYWARIGDAQREAGLSPNRLQGAYNNEFIFDQIIKLIRKLNKFPTLGEFVVEKNNNPKFPSVSVIKRLGRQRQIAYKIIEYCQKRNGVDDIIKLCEEATQDLNENKDSDNSDSDYNIGEVYLLKSGRYYKIGKTNDPVRRGKEIKIQLAENLNLIHSIKTDDPNGIEAYWHKRFKPKRMNGEWFNLTSSDVKFFKRWRKIY